MMKGPLMMATCELRIPCQKKCPDGSFQLRIIGISNHSSGGRKGRRRRERESEESEKDKKAARYLINEERGSCRLQVQKSLKEAAKRGEENEPRERRRVKSIALQPKF